jgi:hypothetical protein
MSTQTKAMLESYARNLIGQVMGAISIVMATSNISSPLDFGNGEWLLVANSIWASLVPVALRWVNKKDPAFGRIATAAAAEATKKLDTAVKASATRKTAAKKSVAKKAAK